MINFRLSVFFFIVLSAISIGRGQSFTKLSPSNINAKTGSWRSVSAIDYDNNYSLDLFLGNGDGRTNTMFVNNMDSTFTEKPSVTVVQNASRSAQGFWADYNNDCQMDVFWASVSGSTNLLFDGKDDTSFTQVTSGSIYNDFKASVGSTWLDADQDGFLDLFVPHWQGTSNSYLFKNSSSGTFTRMDTGALARYQGDIRCIATGDFDDDKDLDIYLANRAGLNALFVNQGNFNFVKDTVGDLNLDRFGSSASWGDYNNDGLLDLYVGRVGGRSNLLYRNDGNGSFTKITSGAIVTDAASTGGTIWGDLDNDGDLDLYTTQTGSANRNIIYRNNGNGGFTKVTSGSIYNERLATEGGTLADINGDGFLDILNANRFSNPISIFTNDGNSNNYVQFRLYGSTSNRYAVGARVEIKSKTLGWQLRESSVVQSMRTTAPYEIHFGLGSDTIIDSVKISWPNGNRCFLTQVAVNQAHSIGEANCTTHPYTVAQLRDSISYRMGYFSSRRSIGAAAYRWDFGDGDTSTRANPAHRYQNPGTYTVCLTTYDPFCKWDSVCTTVDICPDTTQIGFDFQATNLQVQFSDTSNSNAYRFFWQFGDGDTAIGPNPSHLYAATGTYQVCLSLTDSCRTKTLCDSIFVCDSLSPGFSYTLNGLQISLRDSSQADDVSYLFGDGNSDTARNANHVYAQGGYYQVCQVAQNACGTDTLCQTVGVCVDTAVSAFTYSANANLVTFNSGVSKHAQQFFWDFGNGNTSTLANPTQIFSNNGVFSVCLTVTNNCFSDSSCQSVIICPTAPGQAGYSETALGVPLAIKFNDQSVRAISYQWDFGDGSGSTNASPTHIFASAGEYNVCQTITDSCGRIDSVCKIIDPSRVSITERSYSDWDIYPNPVKDLLSIKAARKCRHLHVQLFGLSGQLVLEQTYDQVEVGEELRLSLKHLPKGAYQLVLREGDGALHHSIMKY